MIFIAGAYPGIFQRGVQIFVNMQKSIQSVVCTLRIIIMSINGGSRPEPPMGMPLIYRVKVLDTFYTWVLTKVGILSWFFYKIWICTKYSSIVKQDRDEKDNSPWPSFWHI